MQHICVNHLQLTRCKKVDRVSEIAYLHSSAPANPMMPSKHDPNHKLHICSVMSDVSLPYPQHISNSQIEEQPQPNFLTNKRTLLKFEYKNFLNKIAATLLFSSKV